MLVLALSGCSGDNSASQPPTGDALYSVIEKNGARRVDESLYPVGVVSMDTADRMKATKPAVLVDARPLRMSPELELVDVGVWYAGRPSPRRGGIPWPGDNTCTDRWPPKAFVAPFLHPIKGFRLLPGDGLGVMFFIRAPTVGKWKAEGLVLTYRQGGRLVRQTTNVWANFMDVRSPDDMEIRQRITAFQRPLCEPPSYLAY